ncbi:MAG: hypothetical protein DRP83_00375 [Planctomycetota bacterium]|nr:MAG: hypothetical protein DRP83_00375 [Planctomycetota bacterium]
MARGRQEEEAGKKLHYADKYDIPRATIAEIKDQILLTWKTRQHRGAICIVGEAGIGKSQIIAEIAREEGASIYDIRTAHYGLVGTGIPSTKDSPEGYFDLLVPSVFPKKGEKSIMLFEEINQGLQHSIAMFFSLIEDRRMFNYVLPDEAIVIALMNPATAQYAVTQIENNAALRRRLKWFFALESFKDWVAHASSDQFHMSDRQCFDDGKSRPCHEGVLDFIVQYPKNLYDKKAQGEGKQYMCPATVQTISLDAYMLEKMNKPLDNEFALCRFAASVGIHMGTQLVEHLKDNRTAVRAEDVVLNYKKMARKPVRLLLNKSEQEKITELNVNVLTYMFSLQPDVEVTAGNFVMYLEDLPNEMRVSVLSQLKKYADEANAKDYLFDLMRHVQTHKSWIKIHTSLDDAQTEVERALRGS